MSTGRELAKVLSTFTNHLSPNLPQPVFIQVSTMSTSYFH